MVTLLIIAAAAAVAGAATAGTSAYMQNQNAQAQAKSQRKMAEWQQQVDEQQADAARKQVRLKAQRMLNAQASKAGGAGVVSAEGSLLENQLEAASLSQYEEDLAAYNHELSSQTHGFEGKLFRNQEKRLKDQAWLNVGLATTSSLAGSASSIASSYGSGGKGGSVATQRTGGTLSAGGEYIG
jgi:cell division protein FtsL